MKYLESESLIDTTHVVLNIEKLEASKLLFPKWHCHILLKINADLVYNWTPEKKILKAGLTVDRKNVIFVYTIFKAADDQVQKKNNRDRFKNLAMFFLLIKRHISFIHS